MKKEVMTDDSQNERGIERKTEGSSKRRRLDVLDALLREEAGACRRKYDGDFDLSISELLTPVPAAQDCFDCCMDACIANKDFTACEYTPGGGCYGFKKDPLSDYQGYNYGGFIGVVRCFIKHCDYGPSQLAYYLSPESGKC